MRRTAKRFTEACINLVAKKKDGATFGEFREMWKHLSFSEAWRRAVFAFNHEMVSYNGKYQENNGPAISGKNGRMVRLPSRLLNAADQFSRALIQPVETAAMAYREGMKKLFFIFFRLTNQNNGIILLDIDLMVVVAQLVGAPGCGPGGRRFKSGLPPHS